MEVKYFFPLYFILFYYECFLINAILQNIYNMYIINSSASHEFACSISVCVYILYFENSFYIMGVRNAQR